MAKNMVKALSEKGNASQILVKGTSVAMVNAIRRTVMSEVPMLAIEDLTIYENNGVLFDEFLGHRLGMIPLTMDPKSYKLGDKVKVMLEVAGPGTVYSKDLIVGDPGIEVVDKHIPLAKLKANQRIRIEAEAIAGVGKDHVKFQPAIVGYRMMPQFTIAEDIPSEMAKKIVESCPVNIIELKGKKLNITEPSDCTLCGACEEVGGSKNIQVDPEETGFVINMETMGGMTNSQIIEQAFIVLEEKAKAFQKQIEEAL